LIRVFQNIWSGIRCFAFRAIAGSNQTIKLEISNESERSHATTKTRQNENDLAGVELMQRSLAR